MGQIVIVLGKSGSGKSTSLRNFKPGQLGVFNVAGKMLPFRNSLPTFDNCGYDAVKRVLGENKLNAYVVDDVTYLMAFDNFDKCETKGYEKFTTMAKSFYGLMDAARKTSRDTIVYFLMHPELDQFGNEKIKTVGKMLDEKLCIEGLSSIVIDCAALPSEDGGIVHRFIARNDGSNLAKAPMGMFPDEPMDNDLLAVDTAIREYYGLAPIGEKGESA